MKFFSSFHDIPVSCYFLCFIQFFGNSWAPFFFHFLFHRLFLFGSFHNRSRPFQRLFFRYLCFSFLFSATSLNVSFSAPSGLFFSWRITKYTSRTGTVRDNVFTRIARKNGHKNGANRNPTIPEAISKI